MNVSDKSMVLVLEIEPVMRRGLVHTIDSHPQLRVCAAVAGPPEAREQCARWRPAVVVMDCLAPGGLGLVRELPRWSPGVRVVCFTAAADALSVQRVLQAGARGYVTRADSVEALLATVVAVLAGGLQMGPRVAETLLHTLACGGVEVRETEAAVLTNRELEVYRLLGDGLPTRTVAERLHLSVKTVETHRERIKGKLLVRSGLELQQRAMLFRGREVAPPRRDPAA